MPLVGPWVAARWQSELAHPGALSVWTQRTDLTALLSWTQSLGQFTARHVFIIGFTILILFFLYQEGESLAEEFRRVLRHGIGERAEDYVDLATRALRASVNSMLIVGLFDGFARARIRDRRRHARRHMGRDHRLARLVPFLGYVAVAALTLQLAMTGAATPALVSFGAGCLILFCGDKIVRPVLAATPPICASSGPSWRVSAASRCLASWEWWSVPSCLPSQGNFGAARPRSRATKCD